MNFSSNPCIGNSDSPPTALPITARGAVHPGVNAAKAFSLGYYNGVNAFLHHYISRINNCNFSFGWNQFCIDGI